MKIITLARLKKLGACPAALRAFKRTFGKQARITPDNLTQAEAEPKLDLRWLVINLPELERKWQKREAAIERLHSNALPCHGCAAMRQIPRRLLLAAARRG